MARVLTPPKKTGKRAKGFLEENLGIPVGAASKTNKVRWKKPQSVVKKSTKRR